MRSGSVEEPSSAITFSSWRHPAGDRQNLRAAKPILETDIAAIEAEKLFNNAQDQLADAALQTPPTSTCGAQGPV